MIKKRNLDSSLLSWIRSQGIGPVVGDIFHLVDTSKAHYQQLLDEGHVGEADIFTSLPSAKAAMTSYRHDVLIVHPAWYSETATTTWDLYDSHVMGASVIPNQSRVDLVHETNAFTPFQTFSGRGSTYRNLTFRHGTAEADYVGFLVSGRYNLFDNIYLMSPMVQAQADHTSYIGMDISGHGNYFRGCHFGSDGMARGAKNYNVKIRGVGNVFDETLFVLRADATSPHFINLETADDRRYTWFKACMFYVHYMNRGDQIVTAVERTGAGATADLLFDNRCMFCGVDTLCESADESYIYVPQTYNTTDLTLGLIGLAYDAD